MANKETKKRIREEIEADRARYDQVTRRLQQRIEQGRAKAQDERRERS